MGRGEALLQGAQCSSDPEEWERDCVAASIANTARADFDPAFPMSSTYAPGARRVSSAAATTERSGGGLTAEATGRFGGKTNVMPPVGAECLGMVAPGADFQAAKVIAVSEDEHRPVTIQAAIRVPLFAVKDTLPTPERPDGEESDASSVVTDEEAGPPNNPFAVRQAVVRVDQTGELVSLIPINPDFVSAQQLSVQSEKKTRRLLKEQLDEVLGLVDVPDPSTHAERMLLGYRENLDIMVKFFERQRWRQYVAKRFCSLCRDTSHTTSACPRRVRCWKCRAKAHKAKECLLRKGAAVYCLGNGTVHFPAVIMKTRRGARSVQVRFMTDSDFFNDSGTPPTMWVEPHKVTLEEGQTPPSPEPTSEKIETVEKVATEGPTNAA